MKKEKQSSLESFLFNSKPVPPEAPMDEKKQLFEKIAGMQDEKLKRREKSFYWPWKLLGAGFSFAALLAFFMIFQSSQNLPLQEIQQAELGDFLLSTLEGDDSLEEETENYF